MKRLLILVVAVLGLGASSYAQNDYDVLWVLNNKSTFETVAEYVNATSNQKEYMRAIFYDSTEKLKSALIDNDKEAAENKAQKDSWPEQPVQCIHVNSTNALSPAR